MKKAGGRASSGLLIWAVMSGETGEIGVSDHFREVTKMIVPESGLNGKSGTICRIPDSSDLKSS